MKNVEIRSAYMQAGIKQWQLAEALGISETHFSRKLVKPSHMILTFTCSGYGDFFDGSTESYMYIDDIELVY